MAGNIKQLFKRKILIQTVFIYVAVISANIFVDLLTDGNLHRMMGQPMLYFGGGLLLSFLGVSIMAKVMDKLEKKSR